MGYTVYRRSDGNTTYLGSDYPSTNATSFTDDGADASDEVTYWVRPVNQATGQENNRSYVTATVGGGGGAALPGGSTPTAAVLAIAAIILIAGVLWKTGVISD